MDKWKQLAVSDSRQVYIYIYRLIKAKFKHVSPGVAAEFLRGLISQAWRHVVDNVATYSKFLRVFFSF